jgi:hypothetical protein
VVWAYPFLSNGCAPTIEVSGPLVPGFSCLQCPASTVRGSSAQALPPPRSLPAAILDFVFPPPCMPTPPDKSSVCSSLYPKDCKPLRARTATSQDAEGPVFPVLNWSFRDSRVMILRVKGGLYELWPGKSGPRTPSSSLHCLL